MCAKHCEACNRPLSDPPRSFCQQFFFLLGLSLAVLAFAGMGALRDTVTHLEKLVTTPETPEPKSQPTPQPQPVSTPDNKTCDFPIVYNKPHKTASTRIQVDILRWAKQLHRPAYKCSPFINQATMQMRECIPEDGSGCAVVATHVVMSPTMTRILESKIGKFFLITSTRDPRERLLSLYMQVRHLRNPKASNLMDMKVWLRTYNPWSLYNYHTGGNRVGGCPLDEDELLLLPDLVNKADIVLDMDLYNISQAILKWKGLFQLSNRKSNARYSKDLVLDQQAEKLIRGVTCVEEEMHRLFRLRMASMYQQATGKNCLSDSRHPTTCF